MAVQVGKTGQERQGGQDTVPGGPFVRAGGRVEAEAGAVIVPVPARTCPVVADLVVSLVDWHLVPVDGVAPFSS